MALPVSRDVTFTPLSPVPAATLNHIQDAIIAVNSGSTADFTVGDDLVVTDDANVGGDFACAGAISGPSVTTGSLTVTGGAAIVGGASAASFTATGNVSGADVKWSTARDRWTSCAAGSGYGWGSGSGNWARGNNAGGAVDEVTAGPTVFLAANSTNAHFHIPIHVEPGETITALLVDFANDDTGGTGSLRASLERSSGTSASGTIVSIDRAHGAGRIKISTGLSHAVVAGETYWVHFFITGGSYVDANSAKIFKAGVTVVRT